MKNIKEYEIKMIHNGKRNVKYALVKCSYCRKDKWEQWQRIKRQENFFCNREHCNLWQKDQAKHVGEENARFNWDESNHRWIAQWWEEVGGRRILKNTTKAKWLWEQNHDDVPNGYWVTYKDENPENCELENLELVTRGKRMSKVMMGHKHSEEAKRKMSKTHTGKTLSDEHKLEIGNSLRRRWSSGEFNEIHVGEHSSKWKGGVEAIYPKEYYKAMEYIRDRDKYQCRICSKKWLDVERHFHIHHIDGDKQNNDFDNLILMCPSCHGHIHGNHKIDDPVILAFRSMLKY